MLVYRRFGLRRVSECAGGTGARAQGKSSSLQEQGQRGKGVIEERRGLAPSDADI